MPDKEQDVKPASKKKTQVKVGIQMSLDQYFKKQRPDVHVYTRAYVGSSYRGIIKTIKEWDDELKGKL